MRLLLDTHVAIWWLSGDRQLSIATRRAIERADDVFLSPVSLWEMFVKQDAGRLDPPAWFRGRASGRLRGASLTFEHALEGRALPLLHRDPFDRILIAQALAERLMIVTADETIPRYGVPVLAARPTRLL